MAVIPCHGSLTTLSEVAPERLDDLRRLLSDIDTPASGAPSLPFGRVSTLHFARLVLLPGTLDLKKRAIPPQLLFATDYDLPRAAHYAELLAIAGPMLLRVFQHCANFHGQDPDDLVQFWDAESLGVGAAFVGTPGRLLKDLANEASLREAIETVVERRRAQWIASELTPLEIHAAVVAEIRGAPAFDWVWGHSETALANRLRWIAGLLPIAGALAVAGTAARVSPVFSLIGAAVALVVFAAVLRWKEGSNPEEPEENDDLHVRGLAYYESLRKEVQNEMTGIVFVQPGGFRRLVLRAVLYVVHVLATYRYTHGRLGTIPSIHFARWVIIDNGRRLLFMSNFDGSWESYLGDFIDKAAFGLSLIWSNCWGFPNTRWLGLQGGARDARRFKAYARRSQILTSVWYSAHARWSIADLSRNAALRAGLRDARTPDECAAWCAVL